jgi:ribosomal protein S18 acetylase RimI-like enzyme
MIQKINQYFETEVFEFSYEEKNIGKFKIDWSTNPVSIWSVEIYEKFRGNGFGKQMMEECLDFLRNDPLKPSRIYLYVDINNTPAVRLYKRLGFIFTGDLIRANTCEKMEIQL